MGDPGGMGPSTLLIQHQRKKEKVRGKKEAPLNSTEIGDGKLPHYVRLIHLKGTQETEHRISPISSSSGFH